MYIDWAHKYIPKLFALSAFIINPLFIYIMIKDTKLNLGNYKYLLLYFSIFNMSCSLCDLLVPVCIFDYRYAFSIFVADGYFETPSTFGRYLLAFRCSYITGTYAILHSHFLYRYMILMNDYWLKNRFIPYGLIYSIIYCAAHMASWTFIAGFLSGSENLNRVTYIRNAMFEVYGFDTLNMNIIVAQYDETDAAFIRDSWIGIGSLSAISVTSILILVLLGHLTLKSIEGKSSVLSPTTKRQQTLLIKALAIQTLTPTIASFSPCAFSWYQPVFGIDGGRWLQNASGIAMSTFPFLDPLAIIFCLPTFRRQLVALLKLRCSGSEAPRLSTVFFIAAC